ncbi:MAG: hypothetical protein RLZZ602_2087 [Pseudomonadota bacterium]
MANAPRKATPRAGSTGKRRPAPRRSASRQETVAGPPSLTSAHVKGFLAGALAGILVGAGGVVYLTKESPELPLPLSVSDQNPDERATGQKPRFDFYTVLPSQNLDLGADVEPAELAERAGNRDLYLLQAGSFRQRSDADQRRGELALLGLEAQIERTEGENGVWFRVYLGPFESRSAMARARSITAQQAIDTLLLKRPRTP